MSYIELKNDKYETLEDLKRLLQYILRLDKTAEDSQRANTITNTLAGCQPAMIPNEYLCDPSSVYHLMLFEVRRRHWFVSDYSGDEFDTADEFLQVAYDFYYEGNRY